MFCPEVYTLIKLAATKSIDVSVWMTEENATISEEEFISKIKSLVMVASMEEIEEIKMEVDIAVNDASLETILRVCAADTNGNGVSMVNVSQFLDMCEYTRIPRSTYLSESNNDGDDVDVEVDRTDDSINGDSDGDQVVKATQQYRPDSPDSLNGLGPGKELTVSTRLTTTIANDSNHSDDTCSLGSSKSDRVPVSSSSAPLPSAEVVKTLPTTTINSGGGSSNGILTHPPSKHTRPVSPGVPSTATALNVKPTTATGGVAATAPSSSSLKKVSKVAEGNGKTTTVPFRSQRPASADPRMTMRSRTTPTPTSTTGTQQPQPQQPQPQHHHLQQKYPPSQEQQRRRPSPAAPHPNRPSSSTATAAHSTRDRASFGPDSSKTRASFGPDSTRARARADDVSDMEKFLGFGYGLTSSYDLPPHGTKPPSHGTKRSAHPGRQSLSLSMTASLRGPRDTQSPTRIERSNQHHHHSLSHNYNDYHNSNYNHSNHLITASSSISSSGIGIHVPFRSQSQSAGEFPVFTTLCLDTLKHLEVPLSCILLS